MADFQQLEDAGAAVRPRARRSHLREAGAQVRALLDGYQAKARCGGRRARARFARVCAAVVKEHEQAEFLPRKTLNTQKGLET